MRLWKGQASCRRAIHLREFHFLVAEPFAGGSRLSSHSVLLTTLYAYLPKRELGLSEVPAQLVKEEP